MFNGNFRERSMKWAITAHPFVDNDASEWKACAVRVELEECAVWRLVHRQERDLALQPRVEDTYDMWVNRRGKRSCLLTEFCALSTAELAMQHFDRCIRTEMDMF